MREAGLRKGDLGKCFCPVISTGTWWDRILYLFQKRNNAAERAASEMKQDILSLQKSVQGIVKALEEKPTSVRKKKFLLYYR